jgi:hypothetical protein
VLQGFEKGYAGVQTYSIKLYWSAVSLPAVFNVEDMDNLPNQVNFQDNAPFPRPQAPLARLHLYLAQIGMFRVNQDLI